MNFLHTFLPQPIALQVGPLVIHWYGLFMALALLAGLFVSLKIARLYGVAKAAIYDIFFYLVIFGFFGARLFYVLYNPIYFWRHPLDIFKIWQGGIAIYGALVFGFLVVWWFAHRLSLRGRAQRGRSNPLNEAVPAVQEIASLPAHLAYARKRVARNDTVAWFWLLASIISPGLALGQAIGRWGNYFNQELFGSPTGLPWGIPIALANRPAGFENFEFFHPAFMYESIGDLIIFTVLLLLHSYALKFKKNLIFNIPYLTFITLSYVLLYSAWRFVIEFWRIDPTAGSIGGKRATQVFSLVMMLFAAGCLIFFRRHGRLQTFLRQGDITKL